MIQKSLMDRIYKKKERKGLQRTNSWYVRKKERKNVWKGLIFA